MSRSLSRAFAHTVLAVLLAAGLSACGGGGGASNLADNNQNPVANAGPDQTVASAARVTLAGAGTDADGSIASFAWSQTAGTAVALSSNSAASPTFTAPTTSSNLALGFTLTVTDNRGGQSTDSVVVNVTGTPSTVVVSGKISFDRIRFKSAAGGGLDMNNPVVSPVCGVTVQALSTGSSPVVLGSTQTDASGNYSLSVPPRTSMTVRARAELKKTGTPGWDFSVADNTSNKAIYALDTAVFDSGTADQTRNLHAASGWNGSSYAGLRAAAPFAILDKINDGLQKVLAVDAAVSFPKLTAYWSVNNVSATNSTNFEAGLAAGMIGTSFYRHVGGSIELDELYILGKADVDTDEFDDHVIVHEWGHFFEHALSASDSIGGEHAPGDILDMRVAFGEGFGNALSGIVTDDPAYRDSSGSGQVSDFTINVEDNPTAAENSGWYSEGSVQSILYDLYDTAADGSDTVALGFGPIYRVLVGAQKTTPLQTSIFTFITALKAANAGQVSGINAIVNAQRINGGNIDALGSTEANNADDANNVVLPIYTAITTNGVAKTVCGSNAFGEFNKLGNRRFLTFNLAAASDLTIEVTGSTDTDPDIFLYSRGQDTESAENSDEGDEILDTVGSAPGSYVLEVYDYPNIDDDQSTGDRTCLTVTVNATAS